MSRVNNRLWWIKKNRKAVRIPERIGSTVRALLTQGRANKPSWQNDILSVFAQQGGAELREQILAARLRHGVLYLEVKNSATLYRLRLLWEQRLLEALQAEQGNSSIRAVWFTTRGYKH